MIARLHPTAWSLPYKIAAGSLVRLHSGSDWRYIATPYLILLVDSAEFVESFISLGIDWALTGDIGVFFLSIVVK